MFPDAPIVNFRAEASKCSCGGNLNVLKTHPKIVATFEIGQFIAHETELCCQDCKKTHRSKELCELVAPKSKFGFDIMVFVGNSLFLRCRGEKEIQHELNQRNIPISVREIGYLGKRFIIYLALAHKESQQRIKQLMALRGGYILHLDGTCEGDSPHLMSALDSITNIVIDNVKLSSENSEQIIPFLNQIKKVYGNPIAAVHDMGKGILKAIKEVFPGIADFICHFHFLKDIGKDLFGCEYATLRKALTTKGTRPKLRKNLKLLTKQIDADAKLAKRRDLYLQQQLKGKVSTDLPAVVAAYTWIHWILDWKRELSGYGFPFDRDHYVFYQRLKSIKKAIETLPARVKKDNRISQLNSILISVLNDQNLKRTVTMLQEKIITFDQLREAMQIALPEGKKGLNDDGKDVDIKTIKEKVTNFRNAMKVKQAAQKNVGYKKMLKQIDKYWDKLFADPITVINSQGEKIIIQPQRTNNILERLFRSIKRAFRKRSGNKSFNRTLKALLSDTPLVQNLKNPEYMKALLNGHSTLEERFAAIDVELVRQELKKINDQQEKIPAAMKKVLQTTNLPVKIAKITKAVSA